MKCPFYHRLSAALAGGGAECSVIAIVSNPKTHSSRESAERGNQEGRAAYGRDAATEKSVSSIINECRIVGAGLVSVLHTSPFVHRMEAERARQNTILLEIKEDVARAHCLLE